MADGNSKPTFKRADQSAAAINPDLDDPMWWLARELEDAKLRNRLRVENKYGLGQWDELEEIQGLEAALPLDEF